MLRSCNDAKVHILHPKLKTCPSSTIAMIYLLVFCYRRVPNPVIRADLEYRRKQCEVAVSRYASRTSAVRQGMGTEGVGNTSEMTSMDMVPMLVDGSVSSQSPDSHSPTDNKLPAAFVGWFSGYISAWANHQRLSKVLVFRIGQCGF